MEISIRVQKKQAAELKIKLKPLCGFFDLSGFTASLWSFLIPSGTGKSGQRSYPANRPGAELQYEMDSFKRIL